MRFIGAEDKIAEHGFVRKVRRLFFIADAKLTLSS
jgi:hypothetical protein